MVCYCYFYKGHLSIIQAITGLILGLALYSSATMEHLLSELIICSNMAMNGVYLGLENAKIS